VEIAGAPRASSLHESAEVHLAGPTGVDGARIVDADALRRADLGRRLRNKGRDLSVLHAADPDALLDAWIVAFVRLRVGDVDHVILVDHDSAWPSELFPLGNELAIWIEDLHAAIRAIPDVDAA